MFTQVRAVVRRKTLLLLWWIDGGKVMMERSTLAWQGLPHGHLEASLTSTPSLLDHVRSKNHAPEGFIPFGLRLIFLFGETLK